MNQALEFLISEAVGSNRMKLVQERYVSFRSLSTGGSFTINGLFVTGAYRGCGEQKVIADIFYLAVRCRGCSGFV
jgi:hypothetical protein